MQLFKPHSVISSVLRPLGFKRDGNYWIKEVESHLVYLVIYGSSYGGPDKYIAIRAFFKQLAQPGQSFKRGWHASYDIQEIGLLGGALNYFHEFKDLSDEERTKRLTDGLVNHCVPTLESVSTIDGLKKMWLENPGLLMSPELRSLIGLPFSRADLEIPSAAE
jgi:hypothetical protein